MASMAHIVHGQEVTFVSNNARLCICTADPFSSVLPNTFNLLWTANLIMDTHFAKARDRALIAGCAIL